MRRCHPGMQSHKRTPQLVPGGESRDRIVTFNPGYLEFPGFSRDRVDVVFTESSEFH
jgi:hypothetical protein